MTRFRYIEEPTDQVVRWGSCDDPRKSLRLGDVVEATVEVHSWHTRLIVEGIAPRGFNSASFEEVDDNG